MATAQIVGTPITHVVAGFDGEGGSDTFSVDLGGGSRRAVLIFVGCRQQTSVDVSSVTVGGVAATPLAAELNGGIRSVGRPYYLLDPPPGLQDVFVQLSASDANWHATVIPLADVNQAAPFGTVATFSVDGFTAPDLAVESIAGDLVIDWICHNIADTVAFDPDASQTLIAEGIVGTSSAKSYGGSSYEVATGTSTVMSWTKVSGSGFTAVAYGVAVKGDDGGGGGGSAPTAPSSVVANADSSSQVTVTWTDNAVDEDNFRLERRLTADADDDANYTLIDAGISANDTDFVDTTVSAGTEYTYRLRAANEFGNSSWVASNSVTTPSSGGGGGTAGVVRRGGPMELWAEHGEEMTVRLTVYDYETGRDPVGLPTVASGDAMISADGGVFSATGVTVSSSNGQVVVTIAAAQMQAEQILLRLKDQTSTQEWLPVEFLVKTYGHPSAFDPDGVILKGTAAAVGSDYIDFDTAAGTTTDQYLDHEVEIIESSGATAAVGQKRYISDYSSSRRATLSQGWTIQPSGTVRYRVRTAGAVPNDMNLASIDSDTAAATALKNNIANLDAAISSRASSALTAAAIRSEIDANSSKLATLVAGSYGDFDGYTLVQSMKLLLAVNVGKLSGAGSNAPVFRSVNDTANRVSAVTTADGRTSVTINV